MSHILRHLIWGSILLIAIATTIYFGMAKRAIAPEKNTSEAQEEIQEGEIEVERETAFDNIGLTTNTAIASLDLKEILGGGPVKDGIPAITDPSFISIEAANDWLDDEGLGILYAQGEMVRFYPYAILYWHEIVNNQIGDESIAVTFCPLCGSALIFEAGDDVFGVSGKLWESNLLMYDQKTESLWSQILGEAVVGDRTGETLRILDANVISFAELKASYPNAEVLDKDTNNPRDYGQSPYGNYETNDDLYFPISETNEAFSKKELFHVVILENTTVGFHRNDLLEKGTAVIQVGENIIKARVEDGRVIITKNDSDETLPGLVTMWFSWVTHFDQERVVWPASSES